MQIKIDLKVFILAIILLLVKNIKIYVILMTFTLIHELGHLFAGILMKFKPKSISILPYGFKIIFNVEPIDLNKKIKNGNMLNVKKIIIALAGPVINIIFLIIFSTTKWNLFGITYDYYIYANLLITIFNLLPIYPLDGGRIIKQALRLKNGLYSSYNQTIEITEVTIGILTIISSILIIYYKNWLILLVLMYLWYIAYESIKIFKFKVNMLKAIENYDNSNKKYINNVIQIKKTIKSD